MNFRWVSWTKQLNNVQISAFVYVCVRLTLSLCLCVCVKMCTAQHMYIRVLYNETLNTIEWQMAHAFY